MLLQQHMYQQGSVWLTPNPAEQVYRNRSALFYAHKLYQHGKKN